MLVPVHVLVAGVQLGTGAGAWARAGVVVAGVVGVEGVVGLLLLVVVVVVVAAVVVVVVVVVAAAASPAAVVLIGSTGAECCRCNYQSC